MGNALPPDADHLPALRAGRDLELVPALEGRNVDLRAQRRLGEGDGDLAEHLGVLAHEDGVLLHVHHHVEVAGGAAVIAGLALADQPHPRAGVDAGGDLHRERGLRLVPAHARGSECRGRRAPRRCRCSCRRGG